VERFLFRPGLAERARYYAVVFLNQMPLSHAPSQGLRAARSPPAHGTCKGFLCCGCVQRAPACQARICGLPVAAFLSSVSGA
jgi:hypothetical protein